MTALFFLAIPVLALIFNVLNQNTDMALVILLGILAVFGSFLLYAAIYGSSHILEKAVFWGNSGEVVFILGVITLAIPITIIIKQVLHRKQRTTE